MSKSKIFFFFFNSVTTISRFRRKITCFYFRGLNKAYGSHYSNVLTWRIIYDEFPYLKLQSVTLKPGRWRIDNWTSFNELTRLRHKGLDIFPHRHQWSFRQLFDLHGYGRFVVRISDRSWLTIHWQLTKHSSQNWVKDWRRPILNIDVILWVDQFFHLLSLIYARVCMYT